MLNAPTLEKDDEPEAAAGPEPVVSRPCLVVLGTGRSGTSVTARLLGELGVAIEKSLDAAGEQNPDGFAEDAFIVATNKKLMEILSPGQQLPPDLRAAEARIRSIQRDLTEYIGGKARAHALWGFKDPRTALYLPVYRRVFNRLRLVPKYVLCLRNPADTVASLVAQYGTDADLAQLTWFAKNLAVLRETGLNCFILHYEKLLEDPAGQARRLADFVHDGDERPAFDEAAVLRTVRPSLNRSGAMPTRVTNPVVERLYAALQPCEGAEFDRTALRDVVKELSELEQAFLPWAYLARRKSDQSGLIEELQGKCRRLTEANTELAEDAAAVRLKAEEIRRGSEGLATENARLADRLADARLLTETYQRRAISAEDALTGLREEMAAAERKSLRRDAKPAKAVDPEKLRKLERKRVKGELPYRLGKLVLGVYSQPLGNGLGLPAALLALRAESRRKRAARKGRAASRKGRKG